MTRNKKGIISWFIVSFIGIGVIALIPMIIREIYQSKKYNIKLEVDDLKRYFVAICFGSIFRFVIIYIIGLPFWLAI